jgi:hypothetical protein
MATAMPPHWLDDVIISALQTGDAKQIAAAVANSEKFLDAIRTGLKNKPQPGIMGPTYAQNVRREIQKVVA